MEVVYNDESRTYSVTLTAQEAHTIIWGGRKEEIRSVTDNLHQALLDAEDTLMPDETYKELFA